MTIEKEVKEAMREEKLIIGTRMVMKGIKDEAIKYVICPENCSQEVRSDLDYYNRNFGLDVKKFTGNSRQLGEICGKPFNIMLLGVKK